MKYPKTSRILKNGIVGLALALMAFGTALSRQAPSRIDFARDVQPLLKQHCIECHGPSQQMHGFRLDRRRDAMRGGTVAVIAPGNSAGSRLYLKLIGNEYGPQMPPTGMLAQEQIDVLKAWIDQGAEWPDELSGETPPAPPNPKATRVIEALRDGDKSSFRKLIEEDPSVANLKGPGGTTPLMQAVLYGDLDSVRLLLAKGADPNARNEAGATALMWAVDDIEKVRLLLERGADVNARSNDSRTPLLIAAGLFGNADVVKLVLDRGASLSAKSPSVVGYTTVLSEAARTSDDALMRLLIERGADAKSAGLVALANANRAHCEKCFQLLADRCDKQTLTIAATILSPPFGDSVAVKSLLERGVDPNVRDPKGNTLLMLAASSDAVPVETINYLIEHGADLNAKSPEGRTALNFAKMRGVNPITELLAKAGAKDNDARSSFAYDPRPANSARVAVERSLPLLQRSDSGFMQKAGCVSCHNNTLTAMTVAAARSHGFSVDEQTARTQNKKIAAYVDTWRERALQGVGIPGESGTMSNIMFALAAENYAPDAATDSFARFILSQQLPEGRWQVFAHRPPLENSEFKVTAMSLRSLQVYGLKSQRAKYEAAVKRAAVWLTKTQPHTVDDRTFQVLGLMWTGVKADSEVIRKAVRDLIREQRSDGGWAQLPALASDAYATGQALVALKTAGIVASDPAYMRGVEFLLKTQLTDGSWYVKTRAVPLQPFFESGFPHGHDQWISAAATNWAATALALTDAMNKK